MSKAAGILFLTRAGKVLFLKRGPGGDHPGEWCFPGGTTEDGETAEETAKREATEELGSYPKGELRLHARTVDPFGVDFTTYLQRVDEEFAPQLNGEHTGWAWADVSEPPAPLHPGCRIALDKLTWDELGVARAIADGRLTSPQRYGNVWLFDLRITGTGVSYRGPKMNGDEMVAPEEFVYRRPENYLTEDFLARCNGLQVIMMHPDGALLDSKEFGARTIGAMMLPYIKGDEVWGIAKIYDDDAVRIMRSRGMSTSPAVLLGNGDQKLKTEDGTDLLIEGKPSLLDHLAICERGVWDKLGDPSGVRTDHQQGDQEMFTKEQQEALNKQISESVAAVVPGAITAALPTIITAVRADDAGAGQTLDKVLSAIDSLVKRMDAFEKKADTDVIAADKKDSDDDKKADEDEDDKKADEDEDDKKADAEEKAAKEKADAEEKERMKADSDKLAAATAELAQRLISIEKALPKQLSDADRHAFSAAQARADDVYSAFGKRAPYPLSGEDVLPYRRRLVAGLKEHSPAWKEVDVLAIADAATFKIAEDMILKDASAAALNPPDLKDDELREIVRSDSATGVRTVEFRGRHSFVKGLTRPARHVSHIGLRKEA